MHAPIMHYAWTARSPPTDLCQLPGLPWPRHGGQQQQEKQRCRSHDDDDSDDDDDDDKGELSFFCTCGREALVELCVGWPDVDEAVAGWDRCDRR